MTARNGSAEWHGSVETGSGTIAVGEGEREWWTLVAVCVGTFMLLLDVTIERRRRPARCGHARQTRPAYGGPLLR
jgi:hypothetical protein